MLGLVVQHGLDQTLPGLEEVIDRLITATFDSPANTAYEAEVRRAEQTVLVDRVTWLAAGSPNAQVRATATAKLNRLAQRASTGASGTEADKAHLALLSANIKRFLNRPADEYKPIVAPEAPMGAPIGADRGPTWLERPPYTSAAESSADVQRVLSPFF